MNVDFSKFDIEHYTVNAAGALAILVFGWMLAGWFASLVRKASQRSSHISPTLIPLLAKLTRLGVLAVVILAALNRIGVETSGVFAMLGAAGLAVGLALKDTVSDVAAGIMLLVLRPFDIGDAVNIGSNGGTVNAIDIFQTRLTSFDGVPFVINNSAVRTAVIQNFSRAETRRIEISIGISYQEDIGKAIAAVNAVLQAEPRLLPSPAPLVNSKALSDTAVVILARCTTKASDFENTLFDLNRAIKERLDQEGINLPVQRPLMLAPVAKA